MKPPLAQFQSDKRKERFSTAFQNRLKNLRAEMFLRDIQAQSRVKKFSWREWFGKTAS